MELVILLVGIVELIVLYSPYWNALYPDPLFRLYMKLQALKPIWCFICSFYLALIPVVQKENLCTAKVAESGA
mgnify:CR=1 FL=1